MPQASGIQYLKVVAIAPIFLDNIIHIQAGWLNEGLKLAQLALAMGATDMGGVLTEELEDKVIDGHIYLYVNAFTLSLGEIGNKAVQKLEELSGARNLL